MNNLAYLGGQRYQGSGEKNDQILRGFGSVALEMVVGFDLALTSTDSDEVTYTEGLEIIW